MSSDGHATAVTLYNGTIEWSLHGKLHRLDGPAVESVDVKQWWVNGKLHRLDGPAIEEANGHKEWWVDGKLHRLDGPAIIYSNEGHEWYFEGRCFTNEQDFQIEVIKSMLDSSLNQKEKQKIAKTIYEQLEIDGETFTQIKSLISNYQVKAN